MTTAHMTWIWQHPDWPQLRYDAAALAVPLAEATHALGRLHGRAATLLEDDQDHAALAGLAADALQSSAIEGQRLDVAAVRSSLARRLGVDGVPSARADRHVDGVVEMTLDATRNAHAPLTAQRLQAWQAALFPTGRSGLTQLRVGAWRDDPLGAMQVVSGRIGKQRVHFEAPPAASLATQMQQFFDWCASSSDDHPVIKAGLAHLWLVTLHPFDDGNGRVARAVGDLMLSRADGERFRYYSLSAQIQSQRDDYYTVLEQTQRGGVDVSAWLQWFLTCLTRAVQRADTELDRVLMKSLFWQRIAHVPLHQRHVKALNKVLDGFDKPITNRKWAALTKTSADTALRDLRSLVDAGVLQRSQAGGRSTTYWLVGMPLPQS